ncbi:MAG: DUF815 domain-containing protein [Candidatus Gastranaerophilales bacterium]|nr:DUF815 domain-containing protein [Candidatus Gastranaerophilales bacterium]
MMDSLEKVYLSSYFLCIFKNLKNDTIFKSFIELLKTIEKENDIERTILNYTDFVYNLKHAGYCDFSRYLHYEILKNKNIFDENQLQKELAIVKNLSNIKAETLHSILCQKYSNYQDLLVGLPTFENSGLEITFEDFKNENLGIDEAIKNNRAFIFDNDFEIKPIELSETIKFSSLKGYVEQKRILFENTSAFLAGAKVNNILLYGDAGCGKSSSVRALLNEFEELKIVQIFKNNLINLDKLYLKLKDLPYKFIIFADDISFDEDDNVFSTMKAVIEGSLIQCPKNAVIYATSNRRHLVKETFQARSGDEIHLKDTLNEITSLSERFGINIFFSKPSNDEFNQIVIELAKDNNIEIEEKTLIEKAQRLALIKGSRSPRIAKQLIDNLVAHVDI